MRNPPVATSSEQNDSPSSSNYQLSLTPGKGWDPESTSHLCQNWAGLAYAANRGCCWAEECSSHVKSRRQHFSALLPITQLIYSICIILGNVPGTLRERGGAIAVPSMTDPLKSLILSTELRESLR